MDWYIKVLKNYVGFSGRARRREYWFFYLFNFIFSAVLAIIDTLLGWNYQSYWGVLSTIYGLLVIIPSLAVTFRRLHDTNHSGWWIFISLIPFVGFIIMLIFLFTDSQKGPNRFGLNPKGIGNPVVNPSGTV